jgi:hypothetical protein
LTWNAWNGIEDVAMTLISGKIVLRLEAAGAQYTCRLVYLYDIFLLKCQAFYLITTTSYLISATQFF